MGSSQPVFVRSTSVGNLRLRLSRVDTLSSNVPGRLGFEVRAVIEVEIAFGSDAGFGANDVLDGFTLALGSDQSRVRSQGQRITRQSSHVRSRTTSDYLNHSAATDPIAVGSVLTQRNCRQFFSPRNRRGAPPLPESPNPWGPRDPYSETLPDHRIGTKS